jgi:ribonuclease HI
MWSPDELSFKENGPLLGKNQSSDRAEVRALVAALEKSTAGVHIITDNQYVRNTAQYLKAGGTVHKGKHHDLWTRINNNIQKMDSIRWVKAHLEKEEAEKAGVTHADWYGNDQADEQAKKGAEKHNYTEEQKRAVREKVALAKRVQEHMIKTYIKYINRPEVKEDSLNNKKIKGAPTGKRGRKNITSKDNGHIVQTNGAYEYCALCGCSTKATHTNTNKQDGKT